MHTTYICKIKEENLPKLSVYHIWRKSLQTQECARLIHGKRAIGVQAIEVLLYRTSRSAVCWWASCFHAWWLSVSICLSVHPSVCQSVIHLYVDTCRYVIVLFSWDIFSWAGVSGSIRCLSDYVIRRLQVQPLADLVTFFHGDWSWNIFYSHSLPSPDSRRAVVSFCWMCTNIG